MFCKHATTLTKTLNIILSIYCGAINILPKPLDLEDKALIIRIVHCNNY